MKNGRRPELELAALAKRLSLLWPSSDEAVGLISVAIGAIYGLQRAVVDSETLGGVPGRSDVMKAAEQLSRKRPPPRIYVVGYELNNALLRLDIAFENALRRLTGLCGLERAADLAAAAERKGIPPEDLARWRRIRDEVNKLKHRNPEQIITRKSRRGIQLADGLAATEQLVTLIERVVHGGRR